LCITRVPIRLFVIVLTVEHAYYVVLMSLKADCFRFADERIKIYEVEPFKPEMIRFQDLELNGRVCSRDQ
jgi:hypothetical protein